MLKWIFTHVATFIALWVVIGFIASCYIAFVWFGDSK